MPRYFVRQLRANPAIRSETDCDWWAGDMPSLPVVSDHEAVDTGLLDADGNTIMRAPNPCGFGKDAEW